MPPGGAAPRRRSVAELYLVLRFLLAGLANTAFGYAVFALLLAIGAGPLAALVLGAMAGAAFNFQTSTRLVFRSPARALRFFSVYAVVLALNWAALRASHRAGLGNLEAQALLSLPIAAISFLAQRFFVFNFMPATP